MDFIAEHGEQVIDSKSYKKLDESPQLRKEVMKSLASALSRRKHQQDE
jgi:hypothetical protein